MEAHSPLESQDRNMVNSAAQASHSIASSLDSLWTVLRHNAEITVSLRGENQALSQQLSAIVSERDGALQEAIETRKRMLEIEQSLDALQGRVEKSEGFERQREEYEELMENRRLENEQLMLRISELEAAERDSRQEIADAKLQIVHKESAQRKLEQLENEHRVISSKLSEMQEFEKNMDIMRKELARKNADVNAHLNEIQKLKNSVAESQSKLYDIPRLKEEITTLKSIVSVLEEERDQLLQTHEQAAEYARLFEVQQSSLNEYSQQILEFRLQNAQHEAETIEKDKTIQTLSAKVSEELAVQERLHLQLRSAREYEQQIGDQLKALDDYSGQVLEARKTLHVQEQKIKELQDSLSKAEQLFRSEQSANWILNEKIQTISGATEKLSNEAKILQDERESFSRLLEEKNSIVSEMEERIANYLEANDKYSIQLLDLEHEKSTLSSTIDRLQTQYTALTTDFEAGQVELKALRLELTSLLEAMKQERQTNSDMLEQLQNVQVQEQQLQEQLRLQSLDAESSLAQLRETSMLAHKNISAQMDELRSENEILVQKTIDSNRLIETLNEQVNILTADRDRQNSTVGSLTQQLAEKQKEWEQSHAQMLLEHTDKALEQELHMEALRKQLADSETGQKQAEERLQELMQSLEEAKSLTHEKEEHYTHEIAERERKHSEELARLRAEVESLTSERDFSVSLAENRALLLTQEHERWEQMQKEFASAKENEHLLHDAGIKQANEQISLLTDQGERLRQQIALLTEAKQALEQENERITGDYSELRLEKERISARNVTIVEELRTVKDSLNQQDSAQFATQEMRAQLSALELRIEELSREYESVQAELAGAALQKLQATEELEDMRVRNTEALQTIHKLSEEINSMSLQKKLDKKHTTLASLLAGDFEYLSSEHTSMNGERNDEFAKAKVRLASRLDALVSKLEAKFES